MSIQHKNQNKHVHGEMALWEIAKLEGLEYNEDNKAILEALVEGLPCRPHPKESLKAKGFMVYDYSKKLAKTSSQVHSHGINLSKEASVDAGELGNIEKAMEDAASSSWQREPGLKKTQKAVKAPTADEACK
eukprot:9526023-Lingulodinium_polyedra.AAC.1